MTCVNNFKYQTKQLEENWRAVDTYLKDKAYTMEVNNTEIENIQIFTSSCFLKGHIKAHKAVKLLYSISQALW